MKLILILFLSLTVSCVSNGTGHAYDYGLFEGTPVWELAKAVKGVNLEEIKRLVQEEHYDINYQESKFGQTLLMLSVLNMQYNSCQSLLENGADPNIHDNYSGSSAVIKAAEIVDWDKENTTFLRLLLRYKANPNDIEVGTRRRGNSLRSTPLIAACFTTRKDVSCIPKIKLLLDSGADINYKNEFGTSALSISVSVNNVEAISYLLENGADYKSQTSIVNDKPFYLVDDLRYMAFSLDSKDYTYKMQIVAFLKENGIDYKKVPVPEYVIKQAKRLYPNNWEEYLEKY